MADSRSVDVHQHLWPEGFVAALAAREEPPFLRGSTLELDEGSYEIDLRDHDLGRRLAAMDRDEVDLAVVSLQPTLGIDLLHAEERGALFSAWEEGVVELVDAAGGRLAALASSGPRPGFVGVCVPAATVLEIERLATTAAALERAGGFLFVHPGPAPRRAGAPAWWPALVDYTAEMQAAYLEWLHRGQERHPGLAVVFAILAGGGPIQLERLASRGVDVRSSLHPNVFFDTASYGRRALELCIETFGVEQLVFGSDAPVVDARATLEAVRGFGESVECIVRSDNPERLLQ